MSAWAKMSEMASSLTYLVVCVGMTGKARDGQASLSLSLSGLFLLQGNQTFHMVPSILYSEQSKSLGKKKIQGSLRPHVGNHRTSFLLHSIGQESR